MRAGKLRCRVSLQRFTTAKSATGMDTETWAEIGKRWAEILPASGQETEAGPTARAETSHDIMMRYDSLTATLTPRDRIVYQSRIFDVQQVYNRQERDQDIIISADEVL